jgi:hypothetical protein
VKKRDAVPEIPPFINRFGHPTFDNPCGQNRPNPMLLAVVEPAAIAPVPVARPAHEIPSVPRRTRAGVPLRRRASSLAALDLYAVPSDNADYAAAPESGPLNERLETHARARQMLGLDTTPTVMLARKVADRIAERRARLHRRLRRATVILVASTTGLFGIATASAYFTASGSGSASASVGTVSVSVSAVTGTPTTPLIPGGTGDVTLKVTNSNDYAVTLKTVTGNGTITPDAGHATCSPTGVSFTDQSALGINLPANSTTPVDLADAAAMSVSSANGCQGATFTIPVSITVQKP